MVTAMDEFTQQNAAMVEQSSAGTRNLSEETVALVDQLGRFRLGNDNSISTAARPAAIAAPPLRVAAAAPAAFHGNAAVRMPEADWAEF